MTQKELLYLEDAVGHEESIIKICQDAVKTATDEVIITFMEEQINVHRNLKEELMNLLKEKANG